MSFHLDEELAAPVRDLPHRHRLAGERVEARDLHLSASLEARIVRRQRLGGRLAEQPYRFTIRGVDPQRARVSLYDPLTGEFGAAAVTGRGAGGISVELGLTDVPRLLFIDVT